jgi:hypothetical protein
MKRKHSTDESGFPTRISDQPTDVVDQHLQYWWTNRNQRPEILLGLTV